MTLLDMTSVDMTLMDMDEQKVSPETSAPKMQRDARMPAVSSRTETRAETWPKRFVARIKQGERFQACAYFLATIL